MASKAEAVEGQGFKARLEQGAIEASKVKDNLDGAAVNGGGLQVVVLVGDHQVEDVDKVGHEESAVLKI